MVPRLDFWGKFCATAAPKISLKSSGPPGFTARSLGWREDGGGAPGFKSVKKF